MIYILFIDAVQVTRHPKMKKAKNKESFIRNRKHRACDEVMCFIGLNIHPDLLLIPVLWLCDC